MQRNIKTRADDLYEKQHKAEEKQKQEFENLKLCCKEVFSDVNGKYFLKFLNKLCNWAEEDNNINHDLLVYKKGRRDIWLIVRMLLPKDIVAQIEAYEETDNLK